VEESGQISSCIMLLELFMNFGAFMKNRSCLTNVTNL